MSQTAFASNQLRRQPQPRSQPLCITQPQTTKTFVAARPAPRDSLQRRASASISFRNFRPFLSLFFFLVSPQKAFASVVLSGGFTEAEAQTGGQQRKIVYVNGNWYAFYENSTDIFYGKSADGITWGSAVHLGSFYVDATAPEIICYHFIILCNI